MCNRFKSWICFCWFSPLLSSLVTLYSAKMSLVTSINCKVSRRWGQSWWAAGLLKHCSQATNCSQSQQMFLLFPTSGILQTVDFTSAVNKLWHCHDSAHLLSSTWRKGADNETCIRVCSWPAKEPYAITRVESVQCYQHVWQRASVATRSQILPDTLTESFARPFWVSEWAQK